MSLTESQDLCTHLPTQRGAQAVVECQDAVGPHHLQGHSRHAQLHLLLCLKVYLCRGREGMRCPQSRALIWPQVGRNREATRQLPRPHTSSVEVTASIGYSQVHTLWTQLSAPMPSGEGTKAGAMRGPKGPQACNCSLFYFIVTVLRALPHSHAHTGGLVLSIFVSVLVLTPKKPTHSQR